MSERHGHYQHAALFWWTLVLVGGVFLFIVMDWGLGYDYPWRQDTDCAVQYLLAMDAGEPEPECWLERDDDPA